MKRDFQKEIEELYENNQKLKEFLDRELKQLEDLLSMEDITQEDINEYLRIQESIEQIKKKILTQSKDESSKKIHSTVSFGLIYPLKKGKLFLQLGTLLQELSQQYHTEIILFPIEQVNLEENTVEGTIISPSQIQKGVSSIPPYIYNVTFHSQATSIKTMRKLRRLEQTTIINPINRFNQNILFDMFSSLSSNRNFLINYDVVSPKSVVEFLQNYDECILIPEKGFAENKMISVKKRAESANLYSLFINGKEKECMLEDVYPRIKRKMNNKKYIILEDIKPLHWMNSPLEIRVYLQKNGDGQWGITDMVGKSEILSKNSTDKHVAEKLDWVLSQVLPSKNQSVTKEISELALNCSSLLDYFIPNLGTCTFDFILDQDSNPFLLHVKGWETRSYLYEADKIHWKVYLANAFLYLYFIKQKRKVKKDAYDDVDQSSEKD